MQEIADRLGGTDRMAEFLGFLVRTRTFSPFTSLDFAGDLAAFSGIDLRSLSEADREYIRSMMQ